MRWIKIYEKLDEWEWYKDSKMVHLFIHLLLKANNADGSWRGTEIKRGQRLTGRKSLSQETGISEQSIRTCLNNLCSTNEITIKSTSHFSVITLCNYEKYQSKQPITQPTKQPSIQPTVNQPLTNGQPTLNHKQEESEGVEQSEKEIQIQFPFPSPAFTQLWNRWKQYKKEEHKFSFKSPLSEQASLDNLFKITNGSEASAIETINHTMANTWKGFVVPIKSTVGLKGGMVR